MTEMEEAFRYGVDADFYREELEAMVEASTSPVPSVARAPYFSITRCFVTIVITFGR
jgi:hypothetical protein